MTPADRPARRGGVRCSRTCSPAKAGGHYRCELKRGHAGSHEARGAGDMVGWSMRWGDDKPDPSNCWSGLLVWTPPNDDAAWKHAIKTARRLAGAR